MAEEVLDSWEDMIDDVSGNLVKRFEQVGLSDLRHPMATNTAEPTAYSNTLDESGRPPTQRSSTVGNNPLNDNSNAIKILRRPVVADKSSGMSDASKSQTDSSQANICPQITLEDNTRTQYVPQVRILKRPNAHKDGKDKSVPNDRSANSNRSQSSNKTYEEREAEYAKARLRILGSASAPEETNQTSSVRNSPQTSNSHNASPNRSPQSTNCMEANVPIIRLPIGPDGSRGFTREVSLEQR